MSDSYDSSYEEYKLTNESENIQLSIVFVMKSEVWFIIQQLNTWLSVPIMVKLQWIYN